jgi:hypothetical protein
MIKQKFLRMAAIPQRSIPPFFNGLHHHSQPQPALSNGSLADQFRRIDLPLCC